MNFLTAAPALRNQIANMLSSAKLLQHADTNEDFAYNLTSDIYKLLRAIENFEAAELISNIKLKPICVTSLTSDFCNAAAKLYPFAKIKVNICDKFFAVGDERLFLICLGNLLCNSIMFCNKKPQIRVKIITQTDYFAVCISDNGNGIPKEVVNALNDTQNNLPFGSGLYLLKEYMKTVKGVIFLQTSNATGTDIMLKFPLKHTTKKYNDIDFLNDKTSILYTQLSPICVL